MLERDFEGYSDKKKHEGFFTGLYRRNETFLIASTATFLISMFGAYFLSGIISQFMNPYLDSFKDSISRGEIKLTTLSIFVNNLKVAFFVYVGGIVFGFFTLVFLVFNGVFIGYAASQIPIGNFIVYTLPHGVFELPGIIIAGAAGFKLASVEIKFIRNLAHIKGYLPFKGQLEQIIIAGSDDLKESLILFAIAIVLILIGAFIEANFTLAWGNYIKSMI